MNMQGGGGLEIWQYTNREPKAPKRKIQLGDLGIFAIKIRCKKVQTLFDYFLKEKLNLVASPSKNPAGQLQFFIRDPFDNLFQIVEDDYWFQEKGRLTGGVCGALVGVSNMDRALSFYKAILDYKTVLYKGTEYFSDIAPLSVGDPLLHRVILKNTPLYCGAFSRLLGPSTIELIQVEEERTKIFNGRWWGDLGFIHVCYDVCDLQHHANICAKIGQPLTVNSGDSFEMGEAAGQFAYNEDPDGTLIEYVETHKVPILKKWGWYLNLRKRKANRPLPDWMVKCMGFSKKTLQLSVKQQPQNSVEGIKTAERDLEKKF
jgi:catechol 2,3-dioxygenase-like lactoylglutathione lyase family enzyme